MSSIGYIQVHAFTSRARIPLQDTAITITTPEGNALAFRLTNRSGILDQPVEISVPDSEASLAPDTGIIPYTSVNLYARKDNFREIEIRNIQIFPKTTTDQDLELIPLPEMPDSWVQGDIYTTQPQSL